jgi:hypothetical protein
MGLAVSCEPYLGSLRHHCPINVLMDSILFCNDSCPMAIVQIVFITRKRFSTSAVERYSSRRIHYAQYRQAPLW